MEEIAPEWSVQGPREAIVARDPGIKWFLSLGVKLDELGVRLDRNIAVSSQTGVKVANDPRVMEVTVQTGDLVQGRGQLLLSYQSLKNAAKLCARFGQEGLNAVLKTSLEGINVLPRPHHSETVSLRYNDVSPFQTNFIQQAKVKLDFQSRAAEAKTVVRHRRLGLSSKYSSAEGPSANALVFVRNQELSAGIGTYSWRLRWRSIGTDEPISVSLEMPLRGSWEERTDEAVLIIRKRFLIDGLRLLEEITRK